MLNHKVLVSFLGILVVFTAAQPQYEEKVSCGYQACHSVKPGMTNVHIVPHTHDDVGWVRTVDEYYYGENRTNDQSVRNIINSVILELSKNTDRRFIWVETSFLWQWWQEQNEETRNLVRYLVNSGRLEIIGGGWTMNDEATTYYQSTIDQFTWAFRRLNEMLNSTCGRPRIGWQIDPFGHSRELASMMARFDFDGLFFSRIDHQDRFVRQREKRLEFLWKASPNLGPVSDIFTSVLHTQYAPPQGFCYDKNCNDPTIVDDNYLRNNVDHIVNTFIYAVQDQAANYGTDHIIMTMGNDFYWVDAEKPFTNYDKLIEHVNARQTNGSLINVLYSTPSCYIKALNDAQKMWTTKTDDFFPYASGELTYWTGYYTSRPTLKYFERLGNQFLQVCKQLLSLTYVSDSGIKALNSLREAMGVLQHHDAVSGTEKQYVAEDYAAILHNGLMRCHEATEEALKQTISDSLNVSAVTMESCLKLNISECTVTEVSDRFVVTVYNPLGQANTHFVRLPVVDTSYKVYDFNGNNLTSQLVPIPEPVLRIPGRQSTARYELVFKAEDLPPLGFRAYYVEQTSDALEEPSELEEITSDDRFSISNQKMTLSLNAYTGLVHTIITDKEENLAQHLQQEFLYYEAADSKQKGTTWTRSSGAYIFHPRSKSAIRVAKSAYVDTYKGPLCEEIHQVFTDWISQVVRLCDGEESVEFEWLVGPLPIENNVGKEVISRYRMDWGTHGVFYTDANGREVLKRVKDYRPTWNVTLSNEGHVAGNYYPVTTAISLRLGESELSVLTDRSQGGSSLYNGSIELMLHRRLLEDDGFGVNEALNEVAFGKGLVARGRHRVLLGSRVKSPTIRARQRQETRRHFNMAPWLLFSPTTLSLQEWKNLYKTEHSGLKNSLPENVHLLTLEPWGENDVLIRFEHIMEHTDDPELSQEVTVSLKDLFSYYDIIAVQEMTLDGNAKLTDGEPTRLQWQTIDKLMQHKTARTESSKAEENEEGFYVTLSPMQIRTFVVNLTPK